MNGLLTHLRPTWGPMSFVPVAANSRIDTGTLDCHKLYHFAIFEVDISTYINTKMSVCLFVCLLFHVFLGHFETDWETLWHKLAFSSWECSKTIIFFKMLFFKELLPFFIFLKDFSVNLKSNYRKTKEGRNLNLFANK